MSLHGQNFIGYGLSAGGNAAFAAVDPSSGKKLEPLFHEASPAEIDRALKLADRACEPLRGLPAEEIARFLDRIAGEIQDLGEALIERAARETGLPAARLMSECARTTNQLRLFAELVREGSWIEARIDRALPDRQPLPKPDLRRLLIPIGPVIVFGASNFPLAFSVAGGDTASALAARNPVVVKAHPAHPGTSEMVAAAIVKAAEACGMPEGVFSMLHGAGPEVSLGLVRHPLAQAVGFTGSLVAGRALFDAAAARPRPIPVHAEMGSINPVFLLPGALRERGEKIAAGFHQSVILGVGQFCTNPGVAFGVEGDSLERFLEQAAELFRQTPPATMLHAGICQSYRSGLERVRSTGAVEVLGQSARAPEAAKTEAAAVVFAAAAADFLKHPGLHEEVFGPSTVVVRCRSLVELEEAARRLDGQLTATLHGTEADLAQARTLIQILERKAGRLIVNGFPTGVEVCPSTHHGGPYPATTDPRSTSVGTAAIQRFARPVCYQNFPQTALPPELQDGNPRGIWRLVDGKWTRDKS